MNLERLSFTDDSYLLGNFLELTKDQKLYWKHPSSGKPLEFDFNAVESITLNRPSFEKEQIESQDQKNGDSSIKWRLHNRCHAIHGLRKFVFLLRIS